MGSGIKKRTEELLVVSHIHAIIYGYSLNRPYLWVGCQAAAKRGFLLFVFLRFCAINHAAA